MRPSYSTLYQNKKIPGLPDNFLKDKTIFTNYYAFHGIGLCISTNEPGLLDSLDYSLKFFRCDKNLLSALCVNLLFLSCDNIQEAPIAPRSGSVPVSFSEFLRYYSEDRSLFITVSQDRSIVMCQLEESWATGFFHQSMLNDRWAIDQLLFYPPLAELLKQLHIFNLHAATAANKYGKAAIVTAPTGHGKSTTLVNLVRSGFKYLSDDITLVRETGSGLELLGFPEPVNLHSDSVTNFPELKFLLNNSKHCPKSKHSFRIEEVYQESLSINAVPGWIIFPAIEKGSTTKLLPLSKRDALSTLIPQSVIVANKSIVMEHLKVLTQLVTDCPCFRLRLGKNASEKIPLLFADMIQGK